MSSFLYRFTAHPASLFSLLAILFVFTTPVFSQPGSLDLSFNHQGYAQTGVGADDSDSAFANAIQPDGKIIVVGQSRSDFSIVRYNSDGSLDLSFAGTGKVMTALRADANIARDVAIQSDGKLIVAGTAYYHTGSTFNRVNRSEIALVRYNADGTLDRTFGGEGKITTAVGSHTDGAFGVTIQPDGRIVVVGYSNDTQSAFAVLRYNPDGSLDTSFDGDGKLTTPIGVSGEAHAAVLQADGKIVVTGSSSLGATADFTTVRYNPDGSLDLAFNGTGISRIIDNTGADRANKIVIQPDGKILIAGAGIGSGCAIARLNADGTLDTTFDGEGVVTPGNALSVNSDDSMFVQPDGKIVAVCSAQAGAPNFARGFLVLRFNADGSPDMTFDGDGRAMFFFKSGSALATAAALQADGKLVVAGYTLNALNNPADIGLVRFNGDGALDTTFGNTGKVVTNVGSRGGSADAVAIQPDGKIVNVGTAYGINSDQDIAMVRYNQDGSLDPAFGSGGKVQTSISSQMGQGYAVALQNDGKIVVAGQSSINSQNYFLVVRYNSNGTLDAAFGDGGKVLTSFGGYNDAATAIAIQTDGKLMVAGSSFDHDQTSGQMAFARYNYDGTLDTTFDGDGKLVTPVGPRATAQSIALLPDGRMVAAGITDNGSTYEAVITRYNVDGSPDNSFNGSGILVAPLSFAGSMAASVALQDDGKIVIGGEAINPTNGRWNIVVARFNADGTNDNSFNGSGKATVSVSSFDDQGRSVKIQSDGKIVVAGRSGYDNDDLGMGTNFAVLRFNTDGTVDSSWGQNGIVQADFVGGDFGSAMAIDPQGNIVVSGKSRGTMGIARFLGNIASASYSIAGRVTDSSARAISGVAVMATDSNGETRVAISSSFGYYQFEGLAGGQDYTISIQSKRYQFSPRVVNLSHDFSDIDMVAH